jgi:hypothetical protein
MPNARSTNSSSSAIASTGVASTITRLVVYIAQANNGSRIQFIPRARSRWTVAMKLMPVAIDEKPATNTPAAASSTWLFE